MMGKVKSFFTLIAGWLAVGAIFLFWLFSRRRPHARPAVRVEPKKVPEAEDEMLKAARKEGIIK